MTHGENFTIVYAPPGLVRSGRYNMTDFCVVYEDPHLAIYFDGKGIWGSDALVGYEIRLPKDLAGMEPGDARAVWERVREYVLQQNPLHWRHQNVSMRPFAEEWAGR